MKKLITPAIVLLACITSFSAAAQGKKEKKSKWIKFGNYRQLFYLPTAKTTSSSNYKLETVVTGPNLRIIVLGDREGDQFEICVISSTSDRKIIMRQRFYMDGTRIVDDGVNSWFVTWKKKEVNKFLSDYFGITIKKRKQFIQEYEQKLVQETSPQEVSFLLIKELDIFYKIW